LEVHGDATQQADENSPFLGDVDEAEGLVDQLLNGRVIQW